MCMLVAQEDINTLSAPTLLLSEGDKSVWGSLQTSMKTLSFLSEGNVMTLDAMTVLGVLNHICAL